MDAARLVGPAPAAAKWLERLHAVQALLAAGRWPQTQADGAALYDSARACGHTEIAAEAALAVAKALFNADSLEAAEQWCQRTRDAAASERLRALHAAGWVVSAAVRARLDRTDSAIAAVNEALGGLNDSVPAGARRTVYFGVAITFRGLGLWQQSVGAWRAAVEADRVIGGGSGLIVSAVNLIESALRAYDDLRDVDAPAAERLMHEMRMLEPEVAQAVVALPAGWHRFLGRHVLGGLDARCGRFADAVARLQDAVNEEGSHPVAARGAAWLELARAQACLGQHAAAQASAEQARVRLACDAPAPGGRRPLPGLHDLWRAEQLLGHAEQSVALLSEYHQRVLRNVQALLDAQVAGLTRQLSAQTLRLQNADLREVNAGLTRSVEDISRVASTDSLTGILNRRAIEAAFAGMQAEGRPFVVVMIDLDHFKAVNDAYSHGVGDAVLRRVATSLGEGLRTPDRLGRYGGEEFTLLLAQLDAAAGALVVERLRHRVAAVDWSALAAGLAVTISAGLVGVWPGERFEDAVARADTLLYEAKRLGRNRVVGEPPAAG